MRISEIHPFLYKLRIQQKRFVRYLYNLINYRKFDRYKSEDSLTYTVKKHQSLLRRRLGDSDPKLQENKIVNVSIAASKLDGIIINPGEVFSFWELSS